jgi:hypothetical protein
MTTNPTRSRWITALLPLLAMPVADGREPAKQDADPAEQQRAQNLKVNAAAIEQQARQHWAPQLQVMLWTHLDTAKRICPDLSPEARQTIAAAGKKAVAAAARQLAEMQHGARPQQPGVATASIGAAVGEALEPFASPEALAAYKDLESERRGRADRAAQQVTITILDERLALSVPQRDAIAADLRKRWQPDWNGGMHAQVINNQIVAPDFADQCIAPHLDDRQRAEWKTWCEQAGGARFGVQPAVAWPGQHGVNISGLRADPWWAP